MFFVAVLYEPVLVVSELRTHPWYSAYNMWSRLLVLGLGPFSLLVFFNAKIYNDIVERRRRRLRYEHQLRDGISWSKLRFDCQCICNREIRAPKNGLRRLKCQFDCHSFDNPKVFVRNRAVVHIRGRQRDVAESGSLEFSEIFGIVGVAAEARIFPAE